MDRISILDQPLRHHLSGLELFNFVLTPHPSQACSGFGGLEQETRREINAAWTVEQEVLASPVSQDPSEDHFTLIALKLHLFHSDDILPFKSFLKSLFRVISTARYELSKAKFPKLGFFISDVNWI